MVTIRPKLDDQIFSFIIKIWLDEEEASSKPSWQGTITHVPSGKRKSIQAIQEMNDFILSFLEEQPFTFDDN